MYVYIHLIINSNQVPIDGKPPSPKTGAFLQVQAIASIATKCQGSLQEGDKFHQTPTAHRAEQSEHRSTH